MVAISAEKTNAIQAIFSRSKAVIGVIHCDPFPGSPKYRGKSVSDIVERALRDAENYISGGVHGLIIENHGDIPFSKPEDIGHETSALMAVITEKVRERFAVPLGSLNRCCQRGRSIPLSTRMICPGYGAFATVCCGPPTRAAMSRL